VEQALDGPCPYCRQRLTPANFSLDHAQPVSCGGAWGRWNLEVCCLRYNQTKGILSAEHFRGLLALLASWEPRVRQDVLARLRAGGKLIRHRL
jgi:hypothetical protein